jgi:sugar O-acyltransferase (sialic acid O-acetyltransferase NeuD family)
MTIAGAKGHALEILDILINDKQQAELVFFDNIFKSVEIETIKRFRVIHSIEEMCGHFKTDPLFVLGVGNPKSRKILTEILEKNGGTLTSVIANTATISTLNVRLGDGVNIMHRAFIQPEVTVGKGTLVNAGVFLHHEVKIGAFCELGPSTIVTGNAEIKDNATLGAGVIVLPNIVVGRNAIVAAGAVVTKNVADNTMVAGVPACLKKVLVID